ncbi:hypothetical protein LTR66_016852 [Elasticomyces elasticus]|nr:hypothetical protein LTR66_016852 [Elasticomyces elasticus]
MALGQGPSFDDVPASAAPNKHFASLYSARDRSHSPVFTNTDTAVSASRPSLDSPYQYTPSERRQGQEQHEMNGNGGRRRDRSALPPLQAPSYLNHNQQQDYEAIIEDDPSSYDLVAPGAMEAATRGTVDIEKQSLALFSKEHLQVIFINYLDSLKALRALHYANAILEGLDEVPGLAFTKEKAETITNAALIKRANDAFTYLVQEELPAFITYEYIQVVSASISARISGMLAPHLREASEGLAEVFCLTDPSRPDNPIVFASEEFNRTTQYGMGHVLGRNCRFLQGPIPTRTVFAVYETQQKQAVNTKKSF